MPVLTNWDAEKAAKFGKSLIVAEHTLHTRKMFSDDGLADLLDRYPREAFGVHTMGTLRSDKDGFRKGTPGKLKGDEILEAVRKGRLWINLRNANAHLPEYGALCDEMFAELDAANGVKTSKRDVGVLISSPKARVFYHLDIPLVTLWQIKGEKTMYVYPLGKKFARDEQIEAIVLREAEEEIDYDIAYDRDAEKVVMTPGVVANWPQTAPHRIDNSDCLNVSLSCEFMTFDALIHANALYANGAMRRWWGMRPSIERDGVAAKYAKAALARGFKFMNSRKAFEKKLAPTFVVDPSAENSVRDLAAA
jgi:hypothetical protein